ncbi:MAG: hypothetical protein COA78_26065 [Blastopirellula sp.]|nr:MAG: hypothetical protein COA78_26065 [Blastopirellula sp.]
MVALIGESDMVRVDRLTDCFYWTSFIGQGRPVLGKRLIVNAGIYQMKIRRMWLYLLLAAVGILIILPTLILVTHVDNWSRDLTTNTAETSVDAADENLRTLDVQQNRDATIEIVLAVVEKIPNWAFIDQSENKQGQHVLHVTRTTGVMRYVDDIYISIEEKNLGCRINVRSQSRVGKGDLGQNPRNIKQLIKQLRQQSELFEVDDLPAGQ